MAKALNRIRFACGTCMTRMEVRPRFAGRQVRCPYCQTLLTVPLESPPEKREEYVVSGPTGKPASADEAGRRYITVICSLCDTRMYATEQQVGQKLICPDCETPNVVPPRPRSFRDAASKLPPPPPAAKEEYGISGPTGEPVPEEEVTRRYIPVVCSLCRTRLLATEDLVGQTLTCPDCATVNLVKPLVEKPKLELPTAEEVGEYGLTSGPETPGGKTPQAELFPFKCPLCRTRFHARRDAAGTKMTCPDCRRPFVIPPPPPKVEKLATVGERGEVYSAKPVGRNWKVLIEEIEPTEPADARGDGHRRSEKRPLPQRERRPLPPWPLVTGVFTFPFHGSARNYWLGACATGLLFFGSVPLAVLLASLSGLILIFIVFFFGALAVGGLIWLVWLSRCCLAIVTDSATGSEEVYNWPGGDWIDHFLDSLYLFNSIGYSGGLGLLFDRLLMESGLPQGAGIVAGIWLAFPILLLSFIETGSLLNPFSLPILRSLFVVWPGWLGFYLLSALVWGAAISIAAASVLSLGALGMIPAVVATMTVTMIYFRLLGCLGWYITEKPRAADRRRASPA